MARLDQENADPNKNGFLDRYSAEEKLTIGEALLKMQIEDAEAHRKEMQELFQKLGIPAINSASTIPH